METNRRKSNLSKIFLCLIFISGTLVVGHIAILYELWTIKRALLPVKPVEQVNEILESAISAREYTTNKEENNKWKYIKGPKE